jgi:hypothetical protein
MGRAQDILKRHTFGAKPDATDPAEVLRRIRELLAAPAPSGTREVSKGEQDALLEAARRAAERKDAAPSPEPAKAPVSYRVNVVGRDAAGDLRTLDLIPSDKTMPPYRVKVVGRDGAGNLRTIDLVPLVQT